VLSVPCFAAENGYVDDVAVMRSPTLWPEFPYLRVERRREQRPGSPFCFLRARNELEVDPLVLMGPQWPPPPDIEVDESFRFAYDSVDALASEGWRVVYMF